MQRRTTASAGGFGGDVQTLVLGIGNTLLSDEGVGVHVVRRLQTTPVDAVRYLDGGTLGLSLTAYMADAESLIVVDAAELKAAAGSVQVFEDAAMDHYLKAGGRRSVHEVGLIDLLAAISLAGELPTRRALIGIQPGSLDWGDSPSPRVAAAIPHACRAVSELIERWAA